MRKNDKGFSYIEMLMVLAIMAIMIGMVTISIGLIGRNTVSRTSEKLESLINKARTQALTKGNNYGWLSIGEIDGNVYVYVGERLPANSDDDSAPESFANLKKEGTKICSSAYAVYFGTNSTSANADNNKQILHIGFKQASGGISQSDGTTIMVKEKRSNKSSSFEIYSQTGNIKR